MGRQIISSILIVMLGMAFYGCSKELALNTPDPLNNSAPVVTKNRSTHAMKKVEMMNELLNLTAEQQQQIQHMLTAQKHAHKKDKGYGHKGYKHKWHGHKGYKKWPHKRQMILLNKIMPLLTPNQQTTAKGMIEEIERQGFSKQILEIRIQKTAQKLQLTQEQTTAYGTALTGFKTQMAELRKKSADRKAFRTTAKELREKFNGELQTIFTPEQFTTFQHLKEEHKATRKEHRQAMKKRHHKRHMKRMVKKLNLTGEQQQQFTEIKKNAHASIKSQLSGVSDPQQRRKIKHKHSEKINKQIEAILTPEQLKIHQAHHKNRHHQKECCQEKKCTWKKECHQKEFETKK